VGLFAPAGTPAEVVTKLNAELNRAFASQDVRDKLGALGLESRPNSPADFAAFLRSEIIKWAQAVKDSGAKAD
jgi:tripartite-type tricarboxylate transporter receptor subunit TctC